MRSTAAMSLFRRQEVLAFARSDMYRMTMDFINNGGDPEFVRIRIKNSNVKGT
jgi:hypothetical protein